MLKQQVQIGREQQTIDDLRKETARVQKKAEEEIKKEKEEQLKAANELNKTLATAGEIYKNTFNADVPVTKEFKELDRAFKTLGSKPSQEQMLEIAGKLPGLLTAADKSAPNFDYLNDRRMDPMVEAAFQAKQIAERVKEGQERIETEKATVEGIKEEMNKLQRHYNLIFGANTQTVKKESAEQLKSIEDMVEGAIKAINRAEAEGVNLKMNFKAQEEEQVPGFASGGWVGGPGGVDNVNARLTAGEYVINANSASKYREEVVAINANRGLRASGGSGSTQNNSFGNINISIAGGQTTAASVREFGLALRREIKNGTILPLDGR